MSRTLAVAPVSVSAAGLPPTPPPGSSGAAGRGRALALLVACWTAIPVAVLVVLWSAGWDVAEFGRHPDEAGHFVTGVLVHDWAAGGLGRGPLEFARQFHARYPKVAIGHWPPLFYAIQAGWYAAFGVSRGSAFGLTVAIASGWLLLVFECLRRRVGAVGAVAATIGVLASPTFRYSGSLFMSDLLLAGLGLGAAWAYAAYLERGSARAALGFGALATLALLTKQDAAALAIVPPLCVVALRRWDLLGDWKFYAPAAMVVATCGPAYYLMSQTSVSAFNSLDGPDLAAKLGSLGRGLSLTGLGGLAVTAVGVVAAVGSRRRGRTLGIVLVAAAAGYLAVQLATPVSLDPRYRTALLGATAFAWASAFEAAAGVARPLARALALAGLAAAAAADLPAYQDRQVTGYRSLVAAVEPGDGLRVVLVCSDPMGDGAIVSEFRLQHPGGRFCVLRADKALASSTWMGKDYRLKFDGPDAIESYLGRQPVHLIVIDDWAEGTGAHAEALEALLRSHPGRYPLAASYPIARRHLGRVRRGEARVYEVAANRDARPLAVEVDIPNTPGGPIRVVAGGP